MKKSQRLAAVLLILLMLCGCSMPAAPNTVVLPQTPAENHTESAPASAEPAQTTPETNAFHLEYEQTALPEPLSSVTALAMLEETLLLGGVSETGLALVRLTPEGRSEELPLPGSTEYLYALCPDGAGGAWLLCGSLPKGYFDAFGNFRFLSQEPEGKLALAHYDAAFALQEIVLLQTLYTDRFFQLRRLDGGFCMMSASLLVRLDETGAETARQSLDAKDGWSFAAMQETDGVLYALTRNFYGIELPELRKFTPDTLSALESDVCTSEITGLRLRADGVDVHAVALDEHPRRGLDAQRRDDALGQVLVHGDGAAEVARAGVGDAEQVERRLHPSVLAAGAVERDEHDVRHGADAQNVLAEDIFALVLPARADGVEIRLLTGDGEIAAQAVRRVKNALRRAVIALQSQKQIHQGCLMTARAERAADACAARERHVALHAQAAGQYNDAHSFSS